MANTTSNKPSPRLHHSDHKYEYYIVTFSEIATVSIDYIFHQIIFWLVSVDPSHRASKNVLLKIDSGESGRDMIYVLKT